MNASMGSARRALAAARVARRCLQRVPHRSRQLSTTAKRPTVGAALTTSRRFDADDVAAFARLTGDDNAIHREPSDHFAAPIVHGMLLASLFPALFAGEWPGSVYRSQTLDFLRPVPVAETVTATIVVTKVTSARRRGDFVECDTSVVLDDGAAAVAGTARLWLPP